MKRVRMLVDKQIDGLQYRCSQVVDFPDKLGAQLVKDGEADDSKAAVTYCIDQGAKPIEHEHAIERAANADVVELEGQLDAVRAEVKAEKDAAKRKALKEREAEIVANLKAAKAKE